MIWSAIGFSWFGYGFDWMTQGGAYQKSNRAVAESLAAICVAQAHRAPDSAAALKRFSELSTWKQREFVETAKWAVMPGSDEAIYEVSELCAEKLVKT